MASLNIANKLNLAEIGIARFRIGVRVYDVLCYSFKLTKKAKTYDKKKVFVKEDVKDAKPFGMAYPFKFLNYSNFEIIVRVLSKEEQTKRKKELKVLSLPDDEIYIRQVSEEEVLRKIESIRDGIPEPKVRSAEYIEDAKRQLNAIFERRNASGFKPYCPENYHLYYVKDESPPNIIVKTDQKPTGRRQDEDNVPNVSKDSNEEEVLPASFKSTEEETKFNLYLKPKE